MRRPGFTLIELVTVLLVIGILAGVALPRVTGGMDEAQIEATISHLKTISLAAEMCQNETGVWPADVARGVRPSALVGFLRPNLFETPCPCGGQYDWQNGVLGITAAIAIVAGGDDQSLWLAIDSRIDDGDLSTGRVYKDVNRLMLVLEP